MLRDVCENTTYGHTEHCRERVTRLVSATHIWSEIRDFDRVRTEKGEILGFYGDFAGNYGNFGEIQAEKWRNSTVAAKYAAEIRRF